MGCLEASAEIIREEYKVEATMVCSLGANNVLQASDGVLYSSESEPIFTT